MTSLETLKTSFALDIKLFEESVSRDIGTEGNAMHIHSILTITQARRSDMAKGYYRNPSAPKEQPLDPQTAARLMARRRVAPGLMGTEQQAIEPHSISRAMIRAQLEVMGFRMLRLTRLKSRLKGDCNGENQS
jgi:hypothetical protein